MIRITGKPGEGAGTITGLIIKSLLALGDEYIVFLIDDTSEFKPLGRELNAQFINLSMYINEYDCTIIPFLDKLDFNKRFFIFDICSYNEDDIFRKVLFSHLEDIKTRFGNRAFIFYKSVYY